MEETIYIRFLMREPRPRRRAARSSGTLERRVSGARGEDWVRTRGEERVDGDRGQSGWRGVWRGKA